MRAISVEFSWGFVTAKKSHEWPAENAWDGKVLVSQCLGGICPAGTHSETGKQQGRGTIRFVNQAAMILTLLWVTGHKPEKKSVYHVEIHAILDSAQ